MLKAPVPGLVKTRLAAALGAEEARRIYRRMVERVWAHGTPSGELYLLRAWLGPRARYVPQADGDLGARLTHATAAAFAAGAESVVLLGGDCPGQTHAFFQAAESALAAHDVVIGPARDGGYTLLALRQPQPGLFRDIAWSTGSVLTETLARAASLGLRVALLDPLEDVDDLASWQRAQSEFFPDLRKEAPRALVTATTSLTRP
jgi:rSAM/selenodomain-associated transferase 1